MTQHSIKLMIATVVLVWGAPAVADGQAASSGPAVLLDAVTSDAWIALQRSGAAASPYRQTLSGDAMDKAYTRYINSFAVPIPDRFPRQSVNTGGSGGGK